jgi:TRAP-type C4-dicarboxylate transport system substrate-binding protein
MSAEEQQSFQTALDEAVAWSTQKHLDREAELVAFFKEEGLEVYEPNVEAFREHAQEMYLSSEMAKDWPEGMIDRINDL